MKRDTEQWTQEGGGGGLNVDYNFFGHSVYNLHHIFAKNQHLQFYHTQDVISLQSTTEKFNKSTIYSKSSTNQQLNSFLSTIYNIFRPKNPSTIYNFFALLIYNLQQML